MIRASTRASSAVVVAALVLGLVAALTGCDSVARIAGPDPAETAEELAAALTSGSFDELTFVDSTAAEVGEEFTAIVAGMGDVEPRVSADDVEERDGVTQAVLTWSWPIGEQTWTYQSRAALAEDADTWQVDWAPSVVEPSLGEGARLDLSSIGARRGPILGAGRDTIVTDRPVVRFGIDRTQVPARRAAASAKRLAALVDIAAAPYAARVKAAGEKAFVEAIVFREGEVPSELAGIDAIPGARGVPDELPLAPTRQFAAPLLGSVGPVTAEMIEKEPERFEVGDDAGLSGLQARYDEQLQGTPGAIVDALDAEGNLTELFRAPATRGKALRLTLDVDLQRAAEAQLAGVGPASALVAIRPSSGAILTAANGPGTNGYNMATFGQFAPGSTFKAVSALALLRAGLTPDSPVSCPARIVVNGKAFTNYSDYPSSGIGRIPLRTAVANSCNTAFISQADRIAGSAVADAAASLGLGIDHDLGFPAFLGSVPTPESETEAAAGLIGQGRILASPMAMAAVIASVQSGRTVIPHLVSSVRSAPDGVEPLTRAEATQLGALLRGVVTSGSGRGLADVPGPPVIAKTGTAEFERDGKILTHAWMIAAQGDLAVAAFVEQGESGSRTAGPILEAFLRAAR
ncbi:penicillin-binding transpeptidase domain-containing protein [Nocardioides sp.]|uniref:penicillin-binding transpeptidase domain-containing protein n=1 Tax=Nocardioides sp. TaxID=35761 RepID=UPI003561DA6D